MIDGIEIERIRGIHQGHLEGLTPLTVLVGPSGSGKSTILDALLIAASSNTGDAIGRVVRRRAELPAGAPWLFERLSTTASIRLYGAELYERHCGLSWQAPEVHFKVRFGNVVRSQNHTSFPSADNHYEGGRGPSVGGQVWLVEPSAGANHASLVAVHRDAFQRLGSAADLADLLPLLLPGALGLRVDSYRGDDGDRPILHVNFGDHSVPVAGAGSGIYAIVRLALEVTVPAGAVVLVEEPEAHQHPSVIAHAAKVLRDAARRGVQLVVSTHSLELIDALVTDAEEQDLERLSVVRVVLDNGVLKSSRFPGAMVATARKSIDEDLR